MYLDRNKYQISNLSLIEKDHPSSKFDNKSIFVLIMVFGVIQIK